MVTVIKESRRRAEERISISRKLDQTGVQNRPHSPTKVPQLITLNRAIRGHFEASLCCMALTGTVGLTLFTTRTYCHCIAI